MADYAEVERRLLAQMLAEWLARRTEQAVSVLERRDDVDLLHLASGQRAALAIVSAGAAPPPAWRERVAAFAQRLEAAGLSGVLLWAPAGADLAEMEPEASAVVQQLAEQAAALRPGEAAEARLAIDLHIRKREDEGAYVSAYGGLSAHWARFTDRVKGYFQIDSTALHRLPADEAAIESLVDELVQASAGLATGEQATVPAADYWRMQRLDEGAGVAVLAAPPEDESEIGAALRRGLRSALREAGSRLANVDANFRLVAVYGHYPAMAEEPVGAALRGQDPGLVGGLDMVVLAAEGQVRPLIDITRKRTLQAASPDRPAAE